MSEEQLKGAVRFVRTKRSRLSDALERELWSRTWEYDRAGNLIESSRYDSRGALQNTFRYKYDAGGRELESIEYDGSGSVVQRTVERSERVTSDGKKIVEAGSTVEIWDADDKLLEITTHNEDGSLKDRFVYSYVAGKRVRTARYAGFDDVPFAETIFGYDEAGRLSEVSHVKGGLPQTGKICKYDAGGNKIEEIRRDANGLVSQIVTYAREFDEHGNWITETKTKVKPQSDRMFTVVTRRQIEYY